MSEEERMLVVPGEVIETGDKFLPGEGTRKEGKEIVASRFGLLEKSDSLIKIIPLGGTYSPRPGNNIIGRIRDITFNGWLVDMDSAVSAFLPIMDYPGRVNKNDLTEQLAIGDAIIAKIRSVKSKGIDLTLKERGLRKLEDGFIMKINPTRVPRIIGRAGSMVTLIKDQTGCSILVGQNGYVWIRGKDPDSELLAKKAIELIIAKPFVSGLTDVVKEFLEKQKESKK
ncbi:MAG: exosome complex RNA-binding protein Rrp4 [archaeon]